MTVAEMIALLQAMPQDAPLLVPSGNAWHWAYAIAPQVVDALPFESGRITKADPESIEAGQTIKAVLVDWY